MALDKDKLMASAQKLIQQNKLDKAIKELRRILEEDPKDIRVLQKLGDVHAKLGERAEAAKAYGAVAQFFTEQGFYLKAVAIYKTILRVDPNIVDVNLKLAELYHQLGLMNDCVAQYQAVANALDRQGRTKESLAIIKKMVDLDAENVASRIKLAELYSSQGQPADAVREFETACNQLKQQERFDDFIKVAERLLFHDPNRVELARELAGMYLQRGDAKRALTKLQVCFKANSRDVETLTLLSQAFRDLDQLPKSVSVLRELARVHGEDGRAAEAEAVWRKVLTLSPQDEEAQRALGLAAPQEDFIRHEPSFVGSFPMPASSQLAAAAPLVMAPPPPPPPPAPPPAHLQAKAPTGLGALQGKAPQTANDQVTKLLAETDVYVKYGLREKALAHVKKVFDVDPDNLEAHEKLKGLLIKAGDINAACDEVIACFRIVMGRGDKQKARMYLADLSSIQSTHPAISTMREELDGVPVTAPLAINVLRRQPTNLPPAPAPIPMAGADEEVAVVVDGDADGMAVEIASGVMDMNAMDMDAGLAQEPAGPSDLSNDLMDEGLDVPAGGSSLGSTDEPTMGANADDFSDFLGGGDAVPAPLDPPAAPTARSEEIILDSGEVNLLAQQDALEAGGGTEDELQKKNTKKRKNR